MGQVVQFPTTGTSYNKGYNPADPAYWKRHCCELDARQIEKIVFTVSGYSLSELRKQNRNKHLVDVRQLFVLLCIQHTAYSYPTIGAILGRDHTTIMHIKNRKQSEYLKKMLSDAEKITRYITTT